MKIHHAQISTSQAMLATQMVANSCHNLECSLKKADLLAREEARAPPCRRIELFNLKP